MNKAKRNRLEAAGWKVGDISAFLDLTPQERLLVEVKIALAQKLRECRKADGLTQVQLARLAGTSQSRVAKMESADASVTVDLLLGTLFALDVTAKEVSAVLGLVHKNAEPVTPRAERTSRTKRVTRRA